jgi:four helix bundle protein
METSKSILKDKSFLFAISIVQLYKELYDQKEYILSKQLLRSGTSIGANIREAKSTESRKDFLYKISLAQKECDESLYWLELLKETNYLSEEQFKCIHNEALQIFRMLRSTILTMKKKPR